MESEPEFGVRLAGFLFALGMVHCSLKDYEWWWNMTPCWVLTKLLTRKGARIVYFLLGGGGAWAIAVEEIQRLSASFGGGV